MNHPNFIGKSDSPLWVMKQALVTGNCRPKADSSCMQFSLLLCFMVIRAGPVV